MDNAPWPSSQRILLARPFYYISLDSFAFVDFISVEHATAVLINPRNHKLNGRQLVVEYASPDAVRRGGHREKGAGTPNGQKKFESAENRRTQAYGRGRRRIEVESSRR